MLNDYWFGILPHVFYSLKGGRMLLYNTRNGERINSTDSDLISLLEEMHLKENLGVIQLSEAQYASANIADFIQESSRKNICKCIPISSESAVKPIQMMPILNLQRDVDKLSNEDERSIGENLIHYLLNLSIQITSDCNCNCLHCEKYYKQIDFCHRATETSSNLTLKQIEQIFTQVQYAPLRKLTITGGNPLEYKYLDGLIGLLNNYKFSATFGINYQNCTYKINLLRNFEKEIYVNFPLVDIDSEIMDTLVVDKKLKFVFVVSSENEYEQTEAFIDKHQLSRYKILPFYDGKNTDFFETNVFLEEKDLFATIIKQRQIFAHQKLNTNFFGNLYIKSNGGVFANNSTAELGNIAKQPILELIHFEMKRNTAWRQVRDRTPCNSCIYQFICPSPSNYELVFGRMNLCTYKPNKIGAR